MKLKSRKGLTESLKSFKKMLCMIQYTPKSFLLSIYLNKKFPGAPFEMIGVRLS